MLIRPASLLFLLVSSLSWAAGSLGGATSAAPFGSKGADGLPPIPTAMVGHWFNTQNHSTVGLIVQANKSCELYTERLTSERSSRGCKIEHYRDDIYLVYLKGVNGQCGATADFEFRHLKSSEPGLERLDLDTGGDVHFMLERRLESPAPPKTDTKST